MTNKNSATTQTTSTKMTLLFSSPTGDGTRADGNSGVPEGVDRREGVETGTPAAVGCGEEGCETEGSMKKGDKVEEGCREVDGVTGNDVQEVVAGER